MFYFNHFLHNLSKSFFKNLVLIRFKGIKANYFYVYHKKIILKISHMNSFFTFHGDMKSCDTKKVSDNPKKFPMTMIHQNLFMYDGILVIIVVTIPK
jgi:hypothetical protein